MSNEQSKNIPDNRNRTIRNIGSLKNQIKPPDDFDEPMSEEELTLWYDNPIFPVNKDFSKNKTNKR